MSESSGTPEPTRRGNKASRRQHHQLDQKSPLDPCPIANSFTSLNYLMFLLVCVVCNLIYVSQVSCQLPDDIQRELNQNLAEQARLQALRARHQQQIQARTGANQQPTQGTSAAKPAHDPNNYSYQQVSPPVQYSYYQPYGDLAKTPQQAGAQPATSGNQAAAGPQQPINIDLNNLNIDIPNLPTPQAQTVQTGGGPPQRTQHLTPHFTGAGGLPVLQPVAAANQSPDTFAPAGQAPLQPQAQTAGGPQQGPPLTEADFKDITGGENYGAPGGSDFGMGANQAGDTGSEPRASSAGGDSDAQLREFGMQDDQSSARQAAPQQRQDNSMSNMMQDLGGFNPMASGGGQGARQRQGGGGGGFDPFGAAGFGNGGGGFPVVGNDFGGGFGAPMMGSSAPRRQSSRPAAASDFDFASQPSSQSQGDTAQGVMNGGAPGSLQSLLGNSFPGLGGGNAASMGLDGLARGNNAPESQLDDGAGADQQQQRGRPQRADDGSLDIADLGDRSDGFSGADLGGFEQPTPQNDQDYNYAAAAEQQPRTVPYPDGGPQFVGTLFALGQPQALTQNRYNLLPDKGTYQDYPAYQSGENDFGAVSQVVDETPRARRPGPGRYSLPSPSALAPEHRADLSSGGRQLYDYARGPLAASPDGRSSSLLSREFDDSEGDDFAY